MPIFAITYQYDDRADLRMDTRPEHRAFLTALHEQGTLLAAGAWADDGAPGALLVAQADSADEVATIIDGDPYHRVGVIAHRDIRAWGQLFPAFA